MDLFKLFGRIAIDNDQANSEIDETADRAEKSESKISGAFKKIGDACVVLGKMAVTGLVAAGTAIAALVTSSVKAYADYEQLVGGVETLFKGSADTVMKYAQDAYKTAGLSANEYMEQATSFSASLLQSLGGDTEAAAHVADMAITDMADNANKMGSDITSIQNAYQGFAKQNYTMLDNLKLGYGGTKEEMERLLADAERFSGVKYDISNLNDVFEAIHVIQGELDITGTTALEASTTIQGSAASMKAAWQNMLVGIADNTQDFDVLLTNLIESVGTFAENLIPRIEIALGGVVKLVGGLAPKIAEALPGLVSSVLPSLVEAATNLLNALIDAMPGIMGALADVIPMAIKAILTMLPKLLDAGIKIIGELAAGIGAALPELIPVAIDAILELVMTLLDNVDMLIDAAIAIVVGLADGIINALPVLIEKAPEIIQKLVDALVTNLPKLIEAGYTIIFELAKGILTNLPELIAAAHEIIKSIVTGIIQYIPKLLEARKNIVSNLWDTIASIDWLQLGSDILQGIVNGVLGMLGAWGEVWTNIKDGAIEKWNALKTGVSDVVDKLKSGVSDKLNAMKSWLSNTWTSMKDSAVEKWSTLKTNVSNIVSNLKSGVTNTVDQIKSGVSDKFTSMKNTMGTVMQSAKDVVQEKLNNMKRAYDENGGGIKGIVSGAVEGIKGFWSSGMSFVNDLTKGKLSEITGSFSNKLNEAKNTVSNIFNNIRDTIRNLINNAADVVRNAIDRLKSFFNFEWSLPQIKLPHFTISGNFSLKPPSVPSFGIDWYAKGGIMTDPTVFGMNPANGNAMVGGEAGPEAIAPISTLQQYVKQAVQEENNSVVVLLQRLIEILEVFFPDVLKNLSRQMVLDSGALVGELAPAIDGELGWRYKIKDRG